jgi:hypothetical protein
MDYAQKVGLAIDACQKIDNASLSVLSADTDKVKSYVYSSTKLPEMRGASIILDELNQEEVKRIIKGYGLPGDCILFNKGGSLLALVPTSLEYEVKSEIEKLYLQRTHGVASITVVTEAIAPELNLLRKEFRNITNRLVNKLKLAKEQKRTFPVYEVIAFARRCRSCGIRPANVKLGEGEEAEYLCKSCDNKRSRGEYKQGDASSGKSRFFTRFLESLTEGQKEQMLTLCREHDPQVSSISHMSCAKDLSEISDEDGYIGVIYADGNEIGAKIEDLDSPESFIEFSEKLYEITESSLYSALSDYIRPDVTDDRCILPFEIICVGGDDVFLILPANIALQIANRLCEGFEKQAQTCNVNQLKDATLSVGVVIAKDNFPVYYIYDLVDQLLKSAKQKAKSDPKEIKTAIDFMVLKSQGGEVSDIGRYRHRILTAEKGTGRAGRKLEKLEFTLRPYFREDFDKLLWFVKKLNDIGFPKSKLYAMRESLEKGRENSVLQYLYMMSRAPDNEKRLLREDFRHAFLTDGICLAPWGKVDVRQKDGYKCTEYRTPIADIVEIVDFVS